MIVMDYNQENLNILCFHYNFIWIEIAITYLTIIIKQDKNRERTGKG